MSRLVLLEHPDEAEAYLGLRQRDEVGSADDRIISLHPRTGIWLDRHGISSENTLPYFTSESHARALTKSHELLGWLGQQVDLEDPLGVRDAYTNALLWYSRYYLHHLLWLCEILAEAAAQHPGSAMRAPVGRTNGSANPMIQDSNRYLGLLAEELCRGEGIAFEPVPSDGHATAATPDRTEDGWLKGSAKQLAFSVAGRFHRASLRRMGNHRPLLSITHNHRMDSLVRQARSEAPELPWVVLGERTTPSRKSNLLRQGWSAMTAGGSPKEGQIYLGEAWLRVLERTVLEEPEFVNQIEAGMDQLVSEVNQAEELFCHRGIHFGSLYATRIRENIVPALRRLYREVSAHDEILRLLNPRLVMTPYGRRSHLALGQMCRQRNIPGLLISHGSFAPMKDPLEEMAWRFHSYGLFHGSYSHAALQTPIGEAHANELEAQSEFVRTGPLAWGVQVNRERSETLKHKLLGNMADRRVIVHAGTPKARNSIHFHVYETPDEYVSALQELVVAVNGLENAYLVIKYRPAMLTEEELVSLLPESDNYCISVTESFADVLGLADLLVSFSSTTIEEAIQSRVRVLLYGGMGRYQHMEAFDVTPEEPVEARAVYSVREPEHLEESLKRILEVCGHESSLESSLESSTEDLFQQYIYQPDEITPFPELIKNLTSGPLISNVISNLTSNEEPAAEGLAT